MRRKGAREEKKDVFESEYFVFALLAIAFGIVVLEGLAIIKDIDGQMFGLAIGGLGAIGGYLLKGFEKDRK